MDSEIHRPCRLVDGCDEPPSRSQRLARGERRDTVGLEVIGSRRRTEVRRGVQPVRRRAKQRLHGARAEVEVHVAAADDICELEVSKEGAWRDQNLEVADVAGIGHRSVLRGLQYVIENLGDVAPHFLGAHVVGDRVHRGVNDANIPTTSERRLEEVRHFDELPIQRRGISADPGVTREVRQRHATTHHEVHVVRRPSDNIRHREANTQRVARNNIERVIINRPGIRDDAGIAKTLVGERDDAHEVRRKLIERHANTHAVGAGAAIVQREVVALARCERRGDGTSREAPGVINAVPAIDAQNRLPIQHVVEEGSVRRFIQCRQAALVVEDIQLIAATEEVRRCGSGDRHVHVEVHRLICLHGQAVVGVVEELDGRRIRVYEGEVQLPAEQRIGDATTDAVVENLQRPVAKRVLAKERRERFLGQIIDARDDVRRDLLDPEDVEEHAGIAGRGGHDFQRGAVIQRIEEERAGSPRRCRGDDEFLLEANAVGIQQPDVRRGVAGIGRVLCIDVADAIGRARNRGQVRRDHTIGDTVEIDEPQPLIGREECVGREIGEVRHDVDAAGRDQPAGEVRSRAEQSWSPETILETIGHQRDVRDVVRGVVVEVCERRRLELDGQTCALGALGEGGIVVTGVHGRRVSISGASKWIPILIHDDDKVRRQTRTIINRERTRSQHNSCVIDPNPIVIDGHSVGELVPEIIRDTDGAFRQDRTEHIRYRSGIISLVNRQSKKVRLQRPEPIIRRVSSAILREQQTRPFRTDQVKHEIRHPLMRDADSHFHI